MQARLSLPWESARVLRPLWTEFPAQTVRVHSLQKSADAVLVSIHESGDDICSRALQLAAGSVPAAAACNGGPRENAVSRVVVVRSESGDVWMGAAGDRLARLGRRAGCDYTSLHRSRVARLFAGARKNAEHGQHRGASTCADDDGGRLVADVLNGQTAHPRPRSAWRTSGQGAPTASPSFLPGRLALFGLK